MVFLYTIKYYWKIQCKQKLQMQNKKVKIKKVLAINIGITINCNVR